MDSKATIKGTKWNGSTLQRRRRDASQLEERCFTRAISILVPGFTGDLALSYML
jgi:hypothetical protein